MNPLLSILCVLAFCMLETQAQLKPTHRDIEFAKVGEHSLKLDLYFPDAANPPLVVWVHGGAWRAGSKDKMLIPGLIDHGFAIASVSYRLSPVEKFPAQIHDIKAAIRFLRAHASDYGYDASKVLIAGNSAGGHLAAHVGVTNGHPDFEGDVGEDSKQSSDVHAIADFYGPTNFLTILKQSTPHGLGVRIPALQLLLRAQPENVPDLAKLASPVFHVDAKDPPLLMIHGDQDPQVPINQSHELEVAYKAAGIGDRARLEVIHGGQHGGEAFFDSERMKLLAEFFRAAIAER
ncbi:MAG: acetyl esterase/lipase [Verrucomicrobiales bacterium]